MATYQIKVATLELVGFNTDLEAIIYAADATITYAPFQAAVSALDATITYGKFTGTVYAADTTVTYNLLQALISALDATATYDLFQALISALDADVAYNLAALISDPFIIPALGDLVITGSSLPNPTASLLGATSGTPGSIPTISVAALAEGRVGLSKGPAGDVYWRIWCIPAFLRPQNPALNVDIPFTVWMAYPYDNQLTSIGGAGQTGLSLDLSAPRNFHSCEELVVHLQIGSTAPMNISALYLFNFTTGQGTFLFETSLLDWLWVVPEEPVVETWSWLSDVIRSWDSSEQRISIRKQPRRSLDFTFLLENDADRARELDRWRNSLGGTIVIPYYQYATRITVASAIGDSKIFFDPAWTDVRDGEYVVIYRQTDDTSYLLKLDAVESDGATLDTPLTEAIERYDFVAPAFTCRIENRSGPSMASVSGSVVTKSFVIGPRSSFTRPGSSAIINTFDSLNVLERRPYAPADEVVDANPTIIDNESGVEESKTAWLHALISGRRQFKIARNLQQDVFDSMDYWRDFCDAAYGQRNTWLMPTWRRDLVLATIPTPGSFTIIVAGTTYTGRYWLYDTFKRLQFRASDGTVIWRKVASSVDYPGGNTLLTLTEALPAESRWAVEFDISYLNRVRFASDEIMLTHYNLHTILECSVITVDA